MIKIRWAMVFALMALGLNSQAALNPDAGDGETAIHAEQGKIHSEGIYIFAQDIQVRPDVVVLKGEPEGNTTGGTIGFSKDEPVMVQFGNGEVLLNLRLSESEIGKVPEQIALSNEEFAKLGLRFASAGTVEDLYTAYTDLADTDVAGNGSVRSRRRMHYMGTGGCVAYVSEKLHWALPGNGKDITRILSHKGWKSVSCANPPVGAVASWSGGWTGAGHTAMWNGHCWAYDIACADPGSRYHLLGCVRP